MIAALILPTIISTCSSDTTQDSSVDTADVATVAASQLSEEDIRQQEIKAESDRILAEAQAEYEANHEAKLEPVDLPQSSVKSESQVMNFSDCRNLQSKTMLDVLPNKSFIILDSQEISTIKICTDDGAVLMSCSAPDNTMITTQTDNTAGCD